ncbi:MAG: bifunctional phosphoribosyl-AMP cyclohydrolase/phosphoribosyl-ATP diphosphatase HisIE [Arenimonas sp.]
MIDIDALDWNRQDGLLPAIVQDADSLRVLMLGYMDREALAATQAGGWVTFFSRSRQALWTKGETSGNRLALVSVSGDCDGDALLVLARPLGPTCHVGTQSCFAVSAASYLRTLQATIDARLLDRPEGSYTARLAKAGVRAVAQKVGEEAVETALAAVTQDDPELLGESADLIYHLLLLLRLRGLGLADVERVLEARGG